MKGLHKRVAALASAALALALVGCGGQAAAPEDGGAAEEQASYKVGVLQLVEHAALDAANEGFVAALEDSGLDITIEQQNAQGDQSACQTIAAKLVNDQNDLILGIATPAVEALAGATTDIPIVGTAITDFAASHLVADNDAPGGNITGTSDLTPVADQIAMLHEVLPDAKTVGILICSAESNSEIQAQMAEEACEAAGLTPVRYSVSSSNEIQQVVESMVGKVDAIYAPTDNTIAAGMTTVAMVANENGLPVICGEEGMVDAGGLATIGINYYDLGYAAGEMAVQILKGEADPATTPIQHMSGEDLAFAVNEDTAGQLGIDVAVFENYQK